MNPGFSLIKHMSIQNVRRRLLLCLVSIMMLLPFAVVHAQGKAEQSARTLINNMSNAVRNLNYDGVFIYQRGGQMNTLRLIHKADENGEIERLISLTGAAREVIRNKQSVTCFFPDDQAVMVEKSRPRQLLPSQLPQSMEKLISNYNFAIFGEDRVAGKLTWVVSIKPKDGYRYGYQFWIDQSSSLLLKSELRNRTGLLLEQIVFTQLDILDAIPDEMLKSSISGKGYTWHNNSEKGNSVVKTNAQWQVGWMPNGFTKNNQEVYPVADSLNPVNHMVYSDGLAMVSIFIEKLEVGHELTAGLSKMGGVNAYARIANGYQVTAVGEVPQATVQRMANSVSPGR